MWLHQANGSRTRRRDRGPAIDRNRAKTAGDEAGGGTKEGGSRDDAAPAAGGGRKDWGQRLSGACEDSAGQTLYIGTGTAKMRIERRFTKEGQSAYAEIEFRKALSEIKNPDGSV